MTEPVEPTPVLVTGSTAPLPVEIAPPSEPIPVTVAPPSITTAQAAAKIVATKAATDEGSLVSEGQRAINRLWERTQSIIAIAVVATTLGVVAVVIVAPLFKNNPDQVLLTMAAAGLVLLSNLVGNVTGFYFSRTNHTKVGGVSGQTRGE